MATLHKFNPVRLGYIRDQAAGPFRSRRQTARLPQRPAHPRYRLRRRHPVGAAGAARRADGRRRSVRGEHRGRRSAHAEESGVAVDYRATTAEELAAAGERFDVVLAMEVVEHVVDVDAFVATCADDGEAGRADDRRHAQPHPEELRAGDRRRRIRAALAAARHPSVGQVRHAGRTGERDRTRRPAGDRRARRDLQSVRRSLATVVRHGRQLHAGGGDETKSRGKART